MGNKKRNGASGGSKTGRKKESAQKRGESGGRGNKAVDNCATPRPRLVVNLFHGYGAVAIAAERVGAKVVLCVDNEDDCVRAGLLNVGKTEEERESTRTVPSVDNSARIEEVAGGDGGGELGRVEAPASAPVAVNCDLSLAPGDVAQEIAAHIHARLEEMGFPLERLSGAAQGRRPLDERFDLQFQGSPPCHSISPAKEKSKREPEVGKEWMRTALRLEAPSP